jgi:hypothetical protein
MDPRQFEKSVESRGEGQASLTRQPERKRRFQIIKLEERIAPGGGGNVTHYNHNTVNKNCAGCGS